MNEGPIDHTFLMNSTIAMLQQSDAWPTPLYDIGYRIDYVEQSIPVGENGKLSPDIISKIHESNLILLLECKGGKTVKRTQLEKLLIINGEHLKQFVTVKDRDQIDIHFTYVVNDYPKFVEELELIFPEIEEDIRKDKSKEDIDAIVIEPKFIQVYSKNPEKWTPYLINGFQIKEGIFPQHFIPFSMDDSGEWILRLIARELISLLLQKGQTNPNPTVTTRELLESMFKIYNDFSYDVLKRLQDRVKHYFFKLTKRKQFHKKLESLGRGSRISVLSLKKALEELEKFGMEIGEEEKETGNLEEIYDL